MGSTHNGTEHVRERTLPYHGPFLSSWRSVRFHGSHDGRDIPPPAALPLGDGRGCTRGSHTQLLVQQQQLPKRRQRTNHAAYRALRQRRRRDSVALAPRSRRQGGGETVKGGETQRSLHNLSENDLKAFEEQVAGSKANFAENWFRPLRSALPQRPTGHAALPANLEQDLANVRESRTGAA